MRVRRRSGSQTATCPRVHIVTQCPCALTKSFTLAMPPSLRVCILIDSNGWWPFLRVDFYLASIERWETLPLKCISSLWQYSTANVVYCLRALLIISVHMAVAAVLFCGGEARWLGSDQYWLHFVATLIKFVCWVMIVIGRQLHFLFCVVIVVWNEYTCVCLS